MMNPLTPQRLAAVLPNEQAMANGAITADPLDASAAPQSLPSFSAITHPFNIPQSSLTNALDTSPLALPTSPTESTTSLSTLSVDTAMPFSPHDGSFSDAQTIQDDPSDMATVDGDTGNALANRVLEGIIEVAQNALSAFRNGKDQETHDKLSELCQSLELIGGLGVGPSVAIVHRPDGETSVSPPASGSIQNTSDASGASALSVDSSSSPTALSPPVHFHDNNSPEGSRKRTISTATEISSYQDRVHKAMKLSPPLEEPLALASPPAFPPPLLVPVQIPAASSTPPYFLAAAPTGVPSVIPLIPQVPVSAMPVVVNAMPPFEPQLTSYPTLPTWPEHDPYSVDLAMQRTARLPGVNSRIHSPVRSSFANTSVDPRLVRPSRAASYSGNPPFAGAIPLPFSVGVPVATPIMIKKEEHSRPPTRAPSPESCPDNDSDYASLPALSRRSSRGNMSEGPTTARGRRREANMATQGHSEIINPLPAEHKDRVDEVFREFLSRICCNLEATDSKGEVIHQTLMAKKMARLDESPDFRPFKFRIQAFTNAFIEELARLDLGEDKIALKKVKSYLWHQQPLISRFNEDGKKSKSKGNHIWNIDAKKLPEGGWTFREFSRRIAGTPPPIAYIGIRWSWTPRIWDPQISRHSIRVFWSCQSFPPWLSWYNDELAGTPDASAQDVDIAVEARFIQDSRTRKLVHRFHLAVAPLHVGDSSYARSRRPSLIESTANLRRGASDSRVPQAMRSQRPTARIPQPHHIKPPAESRQVMHILTTAVNRVTRAAHNNAVIVHSAGAGGDPDEVNKQACLVKQQQVLTVTAHAINNEARLMSHGTPEDAAVDTMSSVIAKAVTSVVTSAAMQVAEDRHADAVQKQWQSDQPILPQPVSLEDVSVATQGYVAAAVAITGPRATDVDVLMTANALIHQQQRSAIISAESSTVVPFDDPMRPHSTTM